MKSTKVAGDAGSETRVVILDSGEEAFASLAKFANDAKITTASLPAIGAFETATVGWFDFDKKSYKRTDIDEQCEVLSEIGDIAVDYDSKASIHVHVGARPGLMVRRAADIFWEARCDQRWKLS